MMTSRKMTVAFFSNFMNHHQLYFCLEMQKKLGDGFTFVATEEIPEERLRLGYKDLNHQYDFILNVGDSEENRDKAMTLARESDVMIIGSAPEKYLQERLKNDKLSFRFAERPLKKGRITVLRPHKLSSMLADHTKYRFSNLYLLCASAYTKGDCALVGAYPGKALKWGYFPQVKIFDDPKKMIENKKSGSVLWAGRFLDWKHPELAVEIAKRLKADGYRFSLNMIGIGPLESEIKDLIFENGLESEVRLLGSMPPEEVRKYMEQSEIFLFTSDRNEGWGAVLNESMNSGCAVVANKEIGSVPFLIKDGQNSFFYRGNNIGRFYSTVKHLMDNKEFRLKVGLQAYETMAELWNPEIAADRIIGLSEKLLSGEKFFYEDGPCSKAERM